jgi:hypothetical protein
MEAVLSSVSRAEHSSPTHASVTPQFFSIRNRSSSLGSYSINANGDTTSAFFRPPVAP